MYKWEVQIYSFSSDKAFLTIISSRYSTILQPFIKTQVAREDLINALVEECHDGADTIPHTPKRSVRNLSEERVRPNLSMLIPQRSQRYVTLDSDVHPDDDNAIDESDDEDGDIVPENGFLSARSPSFIFADPSLVESVRKRSRQHSIVRTSHSESVATGDSNKTKASLSQMTQRSWFG
jgi:hypothetical protein